MLIKPRTALTFIELIIVVAVAVIAMSIAVPSYLKMNDISKKAVCINNLKKIAAAVDEWYVANDIEPGTVLSAEDEDMIYSQYLIGGKPKCPANGTYTINPVGSVPQVECSKGESKGHVL